MSSLKQQLWAAYNIIASLKVLKKIGLLLDSWILLNQQIAAIVGQECGCTCDYSTGLHKIRIAIRVAWRIKIQPTAIPVHCQKHCQKPEKERTDALIATILFPYLLFL